MKFSTPALLTCLLSLTILNISCTGTNKIDVEGEYKKIPDLEISWLGVEKAKVIQGSFCTQLLCTDVGEINWESANYTPFINGTSIEIVVPTEQNIREVSLSLKDTNGTTIQNNIPYLQNSNGSYTMETAFKHTGKVILSIKVNFEESGYSQNYLPLDVQ